MCWKRRRASQCIWCKVGYLWGDVLPSRERWDSAMKEGSWSERRGSHTRGDRRDKILFGIMGKERKKGTTVWGGTDGMTGHQKERGPQHQSETGLLGRYLALLLCTKILEQAQRSSKKKPNNSKGEVLCDINKKVGDQPKRSFLTQHTFGAKKNL